MMILPQALNQWCNSKLVQCHRMQLDVMKPNAIESESYLAIQCLAVRIIEVAVCECASYECAFQKCQLWYATYGDFFFPSSRWKPLAKINGKCLSSLCVHSNEWACILPVYSHTHMHRHLDRKSFRVVFSWIRFDIFCTFYRTAFQLKCAKLMLCRHECSFRARSLTFIPIQTHDKHFNRFQSKFTKEFLPSHFRTTFAHSLCVFIDSIAFLRYHTKPSYFQRSRKRKAKNKIYLPKSATLWFRSFFTDILCRAFRSSEMNLLCDLWRGHDKTFVVITTASSAFNVHTSMMCMLVFVFFRWGTKILW